MVVGKRERELRKAALTLIQRNPVLSRRPKYEQKVIANLMAQVYVATIPGVVTVPRGR